MKQKTLWHTLSVKEVENKLKTNPQKGLTEKEAQKRLKRYGKNKIRQEEGYSKIKIFFSQFKSALVFVLIAAAIITFLLDEKLDSLIISIAIIINAVFGFWEENKVSKVLLKLKKSLKTKTLVLREGLKKEILQEKLVPGDIILLDPGSKVPADARIIEEHGMKVSQANLTGEWMPEEKTTDSMPKDTPLADQDNMIYMGCLVETGEGRAIVIETGDRTQSGKIATLLSQTKEDRSPLQKQLERLGRFMAVAIVVICILLFVGGVLRGEGLLMMFETSVAVAVGGMPEALPIVVTVILAIAMERLLKKKGLIRKLNSVETLSSTSIICLDKTKTITQGKMELAQVDSTNRKLALKIASLSNETIIENPKADYKNWILHGSPTDRALLMAGTKEGIVKTKLKKTSKEIAKKRFDPNRKYQMSLRKEKKGLFLYVSGSPERLIEKSKNKKGWNEKIQKMTAKGFRVVGVGYKKIPKNADYKGKLDSFVKDIEFIGLLAFKDPIRPGIKKTIRIAKTAGLLPVIITGDHKNTARSVANEIGLEVKKNQIMEGIELDKLTEKELFKKVDDIKIYARSEPRHKIKIVEAWQKKGNVVAMVGDGINDAPAIKKADIGLAQGSGTEIAKEASDLVILNDSFEVIIRAIKEGRTVLDNLRKSVSYIFADSLTSIIVVGFSRIIFGWPLPILPVQLLWNNIIEDTFPTIAFAFEPSEKDVMKRKPRPKNSSFLTREMKILIFFTGLIDEFLILLLFWFSWKILGYDLAHARTLVFGAICIDTAFIVFSYKNLRKNIWQVNPFNNKWLNLSAILVIVLFMISVYVPLFQTFLDTRPINLTDWAMITGICVASIISVEITKWFFISRKMIEK
ncbi:MAG: HAD-IC family P-type ATPase [Candidatus Moranbacteria bacterium]|nr:HAD-IC family P-type ATPase [Candidatus Moranbacteria bacterium]